MASASRLGVGTDGRPTRRRVIVAHALDTTPRQARLRAATRVRQCDRDRTAGQPPVPGLAATAAMVIFSVAFVLIATERIHRYP
jgi:hypothetical protein